MPQLDLPGFEKIFHSEFKGLCYFAQKYVKDGETAREIVHEAFIALWEKRDTIDTERNVRSYLATGIHNKCLNYLRDNRKFNGNMIEIEKLADFADNLDENDHLIENELSEKIRTTIDELPEKCREVFMLSRNENLKYKDIAERLGISVKTVEAQMSKALQHLRNRLAGYLKVMLLLLTLLYRQ